MNRFNALLVMQLAVRLVDSEHYFLKGGNRQVLKRAKVDVTTENQIVWLPPNATVTVSYRYDRTSHILDSSHWTMNDTKRIEESKYSSLLKPATFANGTVILTIGPILYQLNNSIFRSFVVLPNKHKNERRKQSKTARILIQYPIRIAQTLDVTAGGFSFKASLLAGSKPAHIVLTQKRESSTNATILTEPNYRTSPFDTEVGTTTFLLTGKNKVSFEEIKSEIKSDNGSLSVRFFSPVNVTVTQSLETHSSSNYLLYDLDFQRYLEFWISNQDNSPKRAFRFHVQGITDQRLCNPVVFLDWDPQTHLQSPVINEDSTATSPVPTVVTVVSTKYVHRIPSAATAMRANSKAFLHESPTTQIASSEGKTDEDSNRTTLVWILATVAGFSTLLFILATAVAAHSAYRHSRKLKIRLESGEDKSHCNAVFKTLPLASSIPMNENPAYGKMPMRIEFDEMTQREDEDDKDA